MNELSKFDHDIYEPIMRKVCKFIITSYQQILKDEKKLDKSLEDFLKNDFVDNYLTNRARKTQYGLGNMRFKVETGVNKANETIGYIDIEVLNLTMEELGNEEEYFAFECKRIKNTSKNDKYIDDGIIRFVENKYSKNMPIAGMIAFVEKGRIPISAIIDDLNERLKIHTQKPIALLTNLKIDASFPYSYQSWHKRLDNRPIQLFHLFFDYSDIIA